MSIQIHRTACPRNCYSTCSFKVSTEENKIIGIEAEPLNLATQEGVCLKGLSYVERANSPDRLLQPMRRMNGKFYPISWDEAIDEISDRLQEYKTNYGPKSMFFYTGSGSSGLVNAISKQFWTLFGGATMVYGNLCWPAGLEAVRLTLGENKHNIAWDIENAGLIVLWGKNPAETNIHQMIPIQKAQSKGTKLVVIDPRRTESAEKADLLIQPKPGTDGLLALTLAKMLIEKGKTDESFIQKYVLGYPEFRNSLSDIDPETSATICGVSLPMIEKLAELLGEGKPTAIVPGYGIQRYSNGGQTIRCLLALNVITGNLGKPGACFHYADLQGDVFSKVKEPESYYPHPENDGLFRRNISTARLGNDMLAVSDPPLKMAWVERGNPLCQNPDSPAIRKAFRQLEFRVVVDQFLTDTAMEADLILPAKNMFEQTDIISSYWNPYIQIKPKVVDPPPGVKPETEIYYLLAKKLGYQEEEIRHFIPDPGDVSLEYWLRKQVAGIPGLGWDALLEGPQIAPGLEEIAFSDHRFITPSGKIELLSSQAVERWGVPALPGYIPHTAIDEAPSQFPFSLVSPNTKDRIHSQFGNLQRIRAVAESPHATISYWDAHKLAIQQGSRIRIYNETGELFLPAKIDGSLRPGVIVIYNGYWQQEGACPNELTQGRETDMGHGTAFHDSHVNLEKA